MNVCKALLAHGADASIKTKSGELAIDLANQAVKDWFKTYNSDEEARREMAEEERVRKQLEEALAHTVCVLMMSTLTLGT